MTETAQTYLTLGTETDFPKQSHPLKGNLLDESATQIRIAKGNLQKPRRRNISL